MRTVKRQPDLRESNGQRGRTSGVRDLSVEPAAGARRVRIPEMAVGAALVVGCALAAVIWQANATQRGAALALLGDVQRGEMISDEDVGVVYVSADRTLAWLTPGERSEVVGHAAVADLVSGTLLARSHVSDETVPDDEGVVGFALEPGQYPTERIAPGDTVNIVALTNTEIGTAVIAEDAAVYSVEALAGESRLLISVRTDKESANRIAQAAERGAVRLVLVGG